MLGNSRPESLLKALQEVLPIIFTLFCFTKQNVSHLRYSFSWRWQTHLCGFWFGILSNAREVKQRKGPEMWSVVGRDLQKPQGESASRLVSLQHLLPGHSAVVPEPRGRGRSSAGPAAAVRPAGSPAASSSLPLLQSRERGGGQALLQRELQVRLVCTLPTDVSLRLSRGLSVSLQLMLKRTRSCLRSCPESSGGWSV